MISRALAATFVACLALVVFTASSNSQTSDSQAPRIVAVAPDSNPPVPDGLKVTCLGGADVLTDGATCPVIVYQGVTTWAYSFIDNRVSFALVSYDAQGNVVRNVTIDGARYVWQITPNPDDQTVTIYGQSNQTITVPWSQLGQ